MRIAAPRASEAFDLLLQRVDEVARASGPIVRPRSDRVADAQSCWMPSRKRCSNSSRHGLDDDEALGGDAALAGVLEARVDGHPRRRFEVGVGEDDERVGAAQLEHRFLERRPLAPATRARPPRSLPVSVTAAMRGSSISAGACLPGMSSVWNTPFGNPAPREHLFDGEGALRARSRRA